MKLKILLSIVSAFAVLLFMQSCSNEGSVSNSGSDDTPQFVVYDYNVSEVAMTDATIENDIFVEDAENLRPTEDAKKGRELNPKAGQRIDLARVFNAMNLTDEQKAEIRALMQAKIPCENQWFRKLQAVRNQIVQRANEARRTIIEQVKNGEITREQAHRQINQLNMKVREAIRTHPINEEVRLGLIACRDEFFAAVAELLDEEQLVLWKRFLDSLPKR
jgi:hypothetical protein